MDIKIWNKDGKHKTKTGYFEVKRYTTWKRWWEKGQSTQIVYGVISDRSTRWFFRDSGEKAAEKVNTHYYYLISSTKRDIWRSQTESLILQIFAPFCESSSLSGAHRSRWVVRKVTQHSDRHCAAAASETKIPQRDWDIAASTKTLYVCCCLTIVCTFKTCCLTNVGKKNIWCWS